MHEYAVTESILDIVQEEAAKAGASRVDSVTVVLGELSTFVDQSIELYFCELSKGTVAEGAALIFEKVEAMAVCQDCGGGFRPKHAVYTCPGCGSPVFRLERGREMYVESIEI